MNSHRFIAILPRYSLNLLNHRSYYAPASSSQSLEKIIKNTIQTNLYNLPYVKNFVD